MKQKVGTVPPSIAPLMRGFEPGIVGFSMLAAAWCHFSLDSWRKVDYGHSFTRLDKIL